MGGDCLNFGCVPSKSLLAAARLAAPGAARRGPRHHLYRRPNVDFAAVADGVRTGHRGIAPNDSVERFEGLGVRVVRAEARFTAPARSAPATSKSGRAVS